MEREKQWDRVFLQDEKYSSMFAQWKSSAGRGRPDVLEKGGFLEWCPCGGKRDWDWHSCGWQPGQSIWGNGQGGRACRCVAVQVGFVEVLSQLPQLCQWSRNWGRESRVRIKWLRVWGASMRLSRSPGVHLEVVLERGLETQELKPSSCESDVPGIRGSLKYVDFMFSSLHSETRCKSDQGPSLHSSLSHCS